MLFIYIQLFNIELTYKGNQWNENWFLIRYNKYIITTCNYFANIAMIIAKKWLVQVQVQHLIFTIGHNLLTAWFLYFMSL